MKNIHVLPTSQPSTIYTHSGKYFIGDFGHGLNRNIYITNSEEIKFNDYITDGYVVWQWKDNSSLLGRKKIILTTNVDLIKDGVQAIDDEFLEWFVKNPSCEEVEVEKEYNCPVMNKTYDEPYISYKIIIPKEEPKQDLYERNYQPISLNEVLEQFKKK